MADNLAYLPRIDKVEDGVFDFDMFWVNKYYGDSAEEDKTTESYTKYGVLYNRTYFGEADSIKVTFEHGGWISADENKERRTHSWNEREDDISTAN